LGNLASGGLGWEDRPVISGSTDQQQHRMSRGEDGGGRKVTAQPQTPSTDHQHHIQRNSRPEITDLVEAMHNLRTRKSY